jgi:hypothetical protein
VVSAAERHPRRAASVRQQRQSGRSPG